MAKKRKRKIREEPSELDEHDEQQTERFDRTSDRNEELSTRAEVEEACLDLYADIERGFTDQYERANEQMDFWDIYNCILGSKQFYTGNSKVFVPLVHDAVRARKTRFVNQIFPSSGKNVEVITSEDHPQGMMALLEFYIRKARLRSAIVPQLMKNGDIEGHYNLYMGWVKNERHVTWRTEKTDSLPDDPDVQVDGGETYWDVAEDKITHEYPDVEVLPDADVLILPATARSVEDALAQGGSATVLRRWSKSKIRQLIRDKEIDKAAGQRLLEEMGSKNAASTPDKAKKLTDAAGIKTEGARKFALVYETWTMLNVEGERRLHRVRLGGEKLVLSCKRNPYWCDHVPLISAAAEPQEGSFKGRSEITVVETMQYAANDVINQGFDSATYALLPIVMTDPEKNPRVGSMILNTAAIWETSPQDTHFASFPALWKDAFQIVASCKEQIFQTLSVNPAMIPSQTGKSKTNQAAVAQEQQVDILTTADVVTGLEGSVLTPMLRWFVYLDHQFRQKEITLRQFGAVGSQMNMETIKPVQMDRRWEARWFGVEAARSAQQMQLQMSGLNMVKGIPPQMYKGFELNMAPVLQTFLENLFGPRVAAEVFQDIRKRLSVEADLENMMLMDGMQMPVHPMDDDPSHMKAHMQLLQQSQNPEMADPHGVIRDHLMRHNMQMMQKSAMQNQQAMQADQPGGQGGGPKPPGGPRPGAQSNGPRGGQQPPGTIHQDRLRDPAMLPRPGRQ